MTKKLPDINKDILRELNIQDDRYGYIMSYVMQMIKDYNGYIVDIIKEIPLNLKGKERYFAMFTVGNAFAPAFSSMNKEEKGLFIKNVTNTMKLSNERSDEIADHMMEKIIKDIDKDITVVGTIRDIVSSGFTDSEKDYIMFTFGLVST